MKRTLLLLGTNLAILAFKRPFMTHPPLDERIAALEARYSGSPSPAVR